MPEEGPTSKGAMLYATLTILGALALLLAIEPRFRFDYDDSLLGIFPHIRAALKLWQHGLPLFDPWRHFGEPFLPQLIGGPFYPPGLILTALCPESLLPTVWVIAHLALGASGCAWLARQLGASREAAVMAAAVFCLGGPTQVLAPCWPTVLGVCWTPWFLGLCKQMSSARGGCGGRVAAAALVLAAQVNMGSIQAATYAAGIGLVFLLIQPTRLKQSLPLFTASLGLAFCLAAPVILETVSVLRFSHRKETIVGGLAIPPMALLGTLLPGLEATAKGQQSAGLSWLYQGLVPLLAIAITVPEWRQWNRLDRSLLALAVFGTWSTMDGLGASEFFAQIPVLQQFHHPAGRLPTTGLVLATLASRRWEAMNSLPSRAFLLRCSILAVVAAIAPSLSSQRLHPQAGLLRPLGLLLIAASSAAVLLAWISKPKRGRVALFLTIALLILARTSAWQVWRPLEVPRGDSVAAVVPFVRKSGGRVAPVFSLDELERSPRALSLGFNETLDEQIPSSVGYSIFEQSQCTNLWGYRHAGAVFELQNWRRIVSGSLLEAAGIEYLHLGPLMAEHLGGLLQRYPVVDRTRWTQTHKNPRYRGRAYCVERCERGGLDRILDLASTELAILPPSSSLEARSFRARPLVKFTEVPGRIDIELGGSGEALLVISTAWWPAWVAYADHRVLPIYRAQGMFLAVRVPHNAKNISLRYQSQPVRAGLVLMLFALVTCASLGFLSGRGWFAASEQRGPPSQTKP